MLRRITLENFMSHRHTVIELAEGLTVLTGPNNCGKSAVVAALQILATNQASTHVVRHGEKNCRITVETDDGHTICWNRRNGKVSYTLNGEDVHRLNRSEVPADLHALLRLPAVETNNGKTSASYDIHFGEQKSPIFLLGDPGRGGRAASFFASTSDATHLIAMQHRHRQRVKENKRDAKRLQEEKRATEADLLRYDNLDDLDGRLKRVEIAYDHIQSGEQSCNDLRRLLQTLDQTHRRTRLLRKQRTVFLSLLTPPDQHDLPTIVSIVNELKATRDRKTRHAAESTCFRTLNSPPSFEPVDEWRALLAELRQVESRCETQKRRDATLRPLQRPPTLNATDRLRALIHDIPQFVALRRIRCRTYGLLQHLSPPDAVASTRDLETTIRQLVQRREEHDRQLRTIQSFVRLTEPPEIRGTGTLAEFVTAISDVQMLSDKCRKAQDAASTARRECLDAIQEFVDRNPKCPTCGSALNAETLMIGVTGHGMHDHPADADANEEND